MHHSTEHGDLVAAAKRSATDFTCHGQNPSITSIQFTHKMELGGAFTTPASSLETKLSNA
jgi:hypothetical protein